MLPCAPVVLFAPWVRRDNSIHVIKGASGCFAGSWTKPDRSMAIIRDDAGSDHALQWSLDEWKELPSEIANAGKPPRLQRWMILLLLVIANIVALGIWSRLRTVFFGNVKTSAFEMCLVAFVVTFSILYVHFTRVRDRYTPRVRKALLDCDRCPVCLYDLTGLVPGHDALVRCPECKASWRISPGRSSSDAAPGA